MNLKVNFLIESKNLLIDEINMPDVLRDGVYIHNMNDDIERYYFLEANNTLRLMFNQTYEVNRLNIYKFPRKSRFGEENYNVYIDIWYYDENNVKKPLFWKSWMYEMGWKGRRIISNRYLMEEGFLYLIEPDFNLIKIKGIEIKSYQNMKLTEIELTRVFKITPTSIRINEVKDVEEEYKGYNITSSFVDKDFFIEDNIEYNDKAWLLIEDLEKNYKKNFAFLYVDRIEINRVERIITVNFVNVFDKMKRYMIDENMREYDVDVDWIIEYLCLQSNIHSDWVKIDIGKRIFFIPSKDNIYNVLVNVLKSSGDYNFAIFDNRIVFRLRSDKKYELLSVGEYGREIIINPNLEKYHLEIPKISFDYIWYMCREKMLEIMNIDTNGVVEKIGNNYRFKISGYGNFMYKAINLSKNINDCRSVIYLPRQNCEYRLWVYIAMFSLYFDFVGSTEYKTRVEIRLNGNILNVKLFNDENNMLLYEENIQLNIFYRVENIEIELVVSEGDILLIDGFANGEYCKGLRYIFNTNGWVKYNIVYAFDSEKFDYVFSYSENDGVIKDVNNGKILSSANDYLELYFIAGKEEFNFYYPEMIYENVIFVEPVVLCGWKEEMIDTIEGVIEIIPKNLKYTKCGYFSDIDTLWNNVVINVRNKKIVDDFEVVKSEVEKEVIDKNLILEFENNKVIVYEMPLPRVIIDVENFGERIYYQGINYDDILKWNVEIDIKSLKSKILIMPLQSIYRKIKKISIIGKVWDDGEIIKYEYKNNDSILLYGLRKKEINIEYKVDYENILSIMRRYIRFNTIPRVFLSEQIQTNLNFDVNFFRLIKIHDKIKNEIKMFEVFEYEHWIDILNDNYETSIRAKEINLEEYQGINKNYWGNRDYWGYLTMPVKYWGGEYYG